jgi:hypothetical protein
MYYAESTRVNRRYRNAILFSLICCPILTFTLVLSGLWLVPPYIQYTPYVYTLIALTPIMLLIAEFLIPQLIRGSQGCAFSAFVLVLNFSSCFLLFGLFGPMVGPFMGVSTCTQRYLEQNRVVHRCIITDIPGSSHSGSMVYTFEQIQPWPIVQLVKSEQLKFEN